MIPSGSSNRARAVFFARVSLGLIFFMPSGVDRLSVDVWLMRRETGV